ncbi:MAG TPA: UbiA family prenyltransferase [Acidisoma sp.]|uniref:UbiA family prenyltransferase n=1 Tax=Acidisoma sp. TaxID=1872115 RepID=UPI002B75420F|nr:UbiA family prenyltransferase [Acidisoma sp.]HTI01917.1 UbiA family prenyltransferase [Acidisoma sp.]
MTVIVKERVVRQKPQTAMPLAVDLDGTLIHADLFVESALRFIMSGPFNVLVLARWLLAGIAVAKANLARLAPCSPDLLPYDERIVAWLAEERASGRTIVLATAADQMEADAVAAHLGLFDGVLASDGQVNLKSKRKAALLAELFPDGFVYAGNHTADVAVWNRAQAVVLVNAPPGLQKSVAGRSTVERIFPAARNTLRALLKAVRPMQWAKNFLVFVPMLVGQGWLDIAAWQGAAIAFFALSATASSVYLVNDAADIDADRRHHRKRKRPFASGRLSPTTGLTASALLLLLGLTLAHFADVLWLVLTYLAASTLYTFWLKRKMLVDVFLLAGLYTIRIIIGGVAASSQHDHIASSWLLAFSCFFFLSLALVKRVTEVQAQAAKGGGDLARRGYRATDGLTLKAMGLASGFIATLVLALYLQSDKVAGQYNEPFLLWVLPAAVVYWECRVWLMTDRGEVHDDPLIFAATDRVSWGVASVIAIAFCAAVLLPRGLIPYS